MAKYIHITGANRFAKFSKASGLMGTTRYYFRENLNKTGIIFSDSWLDETTSFAQLLPRVTETIDLEPLYEEMVAQQRQILIGECARLFGHLPYESHFLTAIDFIDGIFSNQAREPLKKAAESEDANLQFILPTISFFLSELAAAGKIPEASVNYHPYARCAVIRLYCCESNQQTKKTMLTFLREHDVKCSELEDSYRRAYCGEGEYSAQKIDNSGNIKVDVKKLILAIDELLGLELAHLPKLAQLKKPSSSLRVSM